MLAYLSVRGMHSIREGRALWYVPSLGLTRGNMQENTLTSRKLICYLIVGGMLLLTIQALGELAVAYPENGAFVTYCVSFLSPAW